MPVSSLLWFHTEAEMQYGPKMAVEQKGNGICSTLLKINMSSSCTITLWQANKSQNHGHSEFVAHFHSVACL